MAVVKVESKTYTVDPLYQWDKNQALEIRGLSLAKVPEIHFTNTAMSRAIVRQSTMDAAGIITVDVPNSLLQKPYKIQVFVCTYEGSTFKTLYKLEVPVKARPQPADYTFEDDAGEVYSYNALENQFTNLQNDYNAFKKDTGELTRQAVDSAEAAATAANETAKNATKAENAEAAAKSAASAAAASANAAAASRAAIENSILKSDIVEIVKVSELPENPADDVLYIIA